jgi:hypothetical protein
MGYIFGNLRQHLAYRLAGNEAFVRWATGLNGQMPLAKAATAFVADVMLQTKDAQELADFKEAHEALMDFIEKNADKLDLNWLIGSAEDATDFEGQWWSHEPLRRWWGSKRRTSPL